MFNSHNRNDMLDFTQEKAGIQRGGVIFLKSHSWFTVGPRFKPKSGSFQGPLLYGRSIHLTIIIIINPVFIEQHPSSTAQSFLPELLRLEETEEEPEAQKRDLNCPRSHALAEW